MSAQPKVTGRVTTARNKIGTLENVRSLVLMGFKAQQVHQLTSASMPDIRDIQEQLGVPCSDKGGRKHRSINTLLETTRRHTEASIFLRSYEEVLLEFYDGGRGVLSTDAFIVAFRHLLGLVPKPELLPEQAIMIAMMYHKKEVALSRCEHSRKCPCVYLVSTTELNIRQHVTVGDCPMCRELYAITNKRNVVRIPDSRQQRELLSKFTD